MKRILTPYEVTHLRRFGTSLEQIDISSYGEMPVEHITGKVEFADMVLRVNKHVLIPRIETEEMVNHAVDFLRAYARDHAAPITLIDVGTGSGAIAIAATRKLGWSPNKLQLIMTDVSADAIAVAQQNLAEQLPAFVNTVTWHVGHLLNDLPPVSAALITANLPYIPTARISALDPSVREYEPHLALDGGQHGFTLIRELLEQAPDFLQPRGSVLLEIDHTHTLQEILPSSALLHGRIIEDQYNRARFALLARD